MRPAHIPGHTNILTAPTNWNKDEAGPCGSLYVRAEKIDGVNFMRSAWDVEVMEALRMACGSRMVLGISGSVHPVVHMEIGALPRDFEPVVMCRQVIDQHGKQAVRVDGLYATPEPGAQHFWALVERKDMTFAQAAQLGLEAVEALADLERNPKPDAPA